MSVANKDEALKCLQLAKKYQAEGNIARAKHFGEKAKNLYSCPEVDGFLRGLQSQNSGASSSARPSPAPTPREQSSGSAQGASSSRNGNAGTRAQQEMISRIRNAKGDFYRILGVERSADDDEIKKAYRKLALKLHPDKCQAAGAEEAFKAVSKAFTCLADADKRAFYDRTGHEDMQSAAAARGGGGGGPQFRGDPIDPQDLFNMMFGGMGGRGFGMGPMHFGGFPQPGFRPQQRQQAQQERHPFAGLINIVLPVVFMLLALFAQTSQPPASLQYSKYFHDEVRTNWHNVPFYVNSIAKFDSNYPPNSVSRQRFERSIEEEFLQGLQHNCRSEIIREQEFQARYQRKYRGKDPPVRPKPNCDRLYEYRNAQAKPRGEQRKTNKVKDSNRVQDASKDEMDEF